MSVILFGVLFSSEIDLPPLICTYDYDDDDPSNGIRKSSLEVSAANSTAI